MNIRQQYVILSAELSSLSKHANRTRTGALAEQLEREGFEFKRCTGVYNGEKENGFFVTVNRDSQLYRLCDIAYWSNLQESILYSDSAGKISLIFADGRRENLPDMRRAKSIKGLENYTIIREQILTTEAQL